MDTRQILADLPWRAPFLMIDRMVECTPHSRIVTEKTVTSGDALVRDAGAGWFPGLLLLEGLSQSAALLFRLSYADRPRAELPLLGFLHAALHGSARVGQSIRFDVRASKMTRTGGVFEGDARVAGTIVAEAELAFAASNPTADRAGKGKPKP